MAVATVDDILSDLPLGFASLILRPSRAESQIERFLIVDADDKTSDGGAAASAQKHRHVVKQPYALIPASRVLCTEDSVGPRPGLPRLEHQTALDRQPDQVWQSALGVWVASHAKARRWVDWLTLARAHGFRQPPTPGSTR